MGTRDNYESVTRAIQAFASQHTWQQAELARRVGIGTPALRRLLLNLMESGMPLEKDDEHPHVYWSVPRHWFPGGVFFDVEDWEVLVHAVLRIGDDVRRAKLLGRLLSGRTAMGKVQDGVERLNQSVMGAPLTSEEQGTILLIEQSLLLNRPLSINYYSTSAGRLRWRVVTPQRLIVEPHRRLVAYCHDNQELRWFRVDNIQRALLAEERIATAVPPEDVERYIASSPDGFHDGSNQELAFTVKQPTASWIAGNLLPGMRIEREDRGVLRVVTRGGALVVARFIVGLGGDGTAESKQLRALVCDLATAACEANR